jgi:hypothetical protein
VTAARLRFVKSSIKRFSNDRYAMLALKGGLMIVKQVKNVAQQWVMEEATSLAGFNGAFFHGSVNWMADDEPFPTSSDVNVMVVVEGSDPPSALHKFPYRDVILDVSYMSNKSFASSDTMLADYRYAHSFTANSLISDPSGQLTKVQQAVSKHYARRKWVRKRCQHARDWLLSTLQWLKEEDPFHDQVFAWLYPLSMPTHITLVAGLENPTVRKCYVACGELLARYGQLPLFESLLRLLGSAEMDRRQVESLLDSCAEAFDCAKGIVKTPFFGASIISHATRPIAIDGSRELIDSGHHREAVFWIIAIHTFCQKALHNDGAPELQRRFTPSYRRLMRELGLNAFAGLQQRNEQLKEILPQVWEATEIIIGANPGITD